MSDQWQSRPWTGQCPPSEPHHPPILIPRERGEEDATVRITSHTLTLHSPGPSSILRSPARVGEGLDITARKKRPGNRRHVCVSLQDTNKEGKGLRFKILIVACSLWSEFVWLYMNIWAKILIGDFRITKFAILSLGGIRVNPAAEIICIILIFLLLHFFMLLLRLWCWIQGQCSQCSKAEMFCPDKCCFILNFCFYLNKSS